MVGDKDAAETNLALALQKNPNLETARSLRARIETENQVAALTKQVEQNPSDEQAKAALYKSVTDPSKSGVANPATIANVAKAQAVLGYKAKAVKNADLALEDRSEAECCD
jgi:uncharacterized protein YgiB involved in biofilm formation